MNKSFFKMGDDYQLFTEVNGVSTQISISQEALDLYTNEWRVDWVKRGFTPDIKSRIEAMVTRAAEVAKARAISPLLVSIAGYDLVHGEDDLLCFTKDGDEVQL